MLRPTPTKKSMWASPIEWRTRIYLLCTRMSGRNKIKNDKDNDNNSKYFSDNTCTQLQCQCGQFYDTIIIRQGCWYSSLFPSLYLYILVRVYINFTIYYFITYYKREEKKRHSQAICYILRRNWGICGVALYSPRSLIVCYPDNVRFSFFLIRHSKIEHSKPQLRRIFNPITSKHMKNLDDAK